MLGRVPAPTEEPRTTGSLLSAAIDGDVSSDRWMHGVWMWPETVPGWRLVADCDPAQADHGLDDASPLLPVGAVPFAIQTKTTVRTSDLEELKARARMQLDAATSPALAHELWTGELTTEQGGWQTAEGAPFTLGNPRPAASGTADDGPWLNPHLAAATMLTAEADPAAAVGAVESAAARLVSGTVTIHIPVELLLYLGQFGIAPGEDGHLRTPLGSLVVADSGSPGTAPGGTGTAVYATGPIQVWLGEPTVHADPDSVFHPGTNAVACWAERPAAVLFDTQTLVGCAIT